MPYANPKTTTSAGDFELLSALKQNRIPTETMELAIAIRARLKGVIMHEDVHEMGTDGDSADLEVTVGSQRFLINVSRLDHVDVEDEVQ